MKTENGMHSSEENPSEDNNRNVDPLPNKNASFNGPGEEHPFVIRRKANEILAAYLATEAEVERTTAIYMELEEKFGDETASGHDFVYGTFIGAVLVLEWLQATHWPVPCDQMPLVELLQRILSCDGDRCLIPVDRVGRSYLWEERDHNLGRKDLN